MKYLPLILLILISCTHKTIPYSSIYKIELKKYIDTCRICVPVRISVFKYVNNIK